MSVSSAKPNPNRNNFFMMFNPFSSRVECPSASVLAGGLF
jgi:hypothetical protein